jgi:4a-hydroxytetrahydrobiopterin dehydratase
MWQEVDNSLYRKFECKDFDEAVAFITDVAQIARRLNHHPKITNVYNVVELWLTSHDAGNTVTDKDREFAKQVDKLARA